MKCALKKTMRTKFNEVSKYINRHENMVQNLSIKYIANYYVLC